MNRKHLIWATCATLLVTATGSPAADHLEPGRQGETMPDDLKTPVLPQPYTKGVRIVGHADLGSGRENLIMAWSDHCAYVSNSAQLGVGMAERQSAISPTAGVAVVDVRNPTAPKVRGYLQDKGALAAGETVHAITTRDRAVLAASTYGFVPGGAPGIKAATEGWLDIYDVSDCAHPRLTAEVKWPEPAHTITISPNGRRVYGTIINPFTGEGGIQVMDISNLARPRFVGRFGVTPADGTTYDFATHEVAISPDERRIYAGVIASKGGDLNREFTSPRISAERLGPEAGGIYVLDNSDIVDGKPDPKLRLIGTAQHAGWHSPVQAQIKGVPYLVGAGELGACPASWPRITEISDEAHPRMVGQFRLAMNRKENCPPPSEEEMRSAGIIGRPGTATTHFNDVDSATDTRLGLFPFSYAGLRIADLQDPTDPVEIAYFKPGDPCMSHVRYVPQTGHIWFACTLSGFHVLELTPEVRAELKRGASVPK